MQPTLPHKNILKNGYMINYADHQASLQFVWKNRTLRLVMDYHDAATANKNADKDLKQAIDKMISLAEVFQLGKETKSLTLHHDNYLSRTKINQREKTYRSIGDKLSQLERKYSNDTTKHDTIFKAIQVFEYYRLMNAPKIRRKPRDTPDVTVSLEVEELSSRDYQDLARKVSGELDDESSEEEVRLATKRKRAQPEQMDGSTDVALDEDSAEYYSAQESDGEGLADLADGVELIDDVFRDESSSDD